MFDEEKFSKWLETGLQTMKDENAYCLNLYDEDDEWTCELVATNKFYKDGNDWCFDETKVYKREKPFVLITKYSQGNYEKILNDFHLPFKILFVITTILKILLQTKLSHMVL